VTVRGFSSVVGVECAKLAAQIKVRVLIAVCVAAPFVFAAVMRVQSSVPSDTLFGRAVNESGFAVPLVILGFAALWALPVLASVVGGDLFSAEDRYGTWKTVLTRSRSRFELFTGKVLTAFGFSSMAVAVLAFSSVTAGMLIIGRQPLIDLTGVVVPPPQALTRVALAWTSIVPPALGITAVAVLVSVATRSSAAGVGLPVVIALTMQLYAFVDGPEAIRRLMITSAFGAWHGLLSEPPYYRPLLHGTVVSGLYLVLSLTIAYRMLQRRDIGG
jgi:ABC-2 type transport system permease protein